MDESEEESSSDYHSIIVKSIKRLYKSEESMKFDLTLVATDDRFAIDCHCFVVSMFSNLIKQMSVSLAKRRQHSIQSTLNSHLSVCISRVKGEHLESVVKYMYTGDLRLTVENVDHIETIFTELDINSTIFKQLVNEQLQTRVNRSIRCDRDEREAETRNRTVEVIGDQTLATLDSQTSVLQITDGVNYTAINARSERTDNNYCHCLQEAYLFDEIRD
ncbi:hypothetical protein B4U79_18143 [Dinothrombium tinctorium]|uniref:BTB domain-containing protein n=1 Tax=Dinothrombium tinctorium TaxID=1965070 RepID=A0A3S4QXE6_9ACAR|nr:hypothetical protein B4U79_18143 [Dinothrombium tinctorium]